mmetsp:Transcript_8093/g.13039  ORF Transcript_8093/g.13039 Transcript_8093/m.13039 type:complete len:104 (+) Transcript_8093:2-313(+)
MKMRTVGIRPNSVVSMHRNHARNNNHGEYHSGSMSGKKKLSIDIETTMSAHRRPEEAPTTIFTTKGPPMTFNKVSTVAAQRSDRSTTDRGPHPQWIQQQQLVT